MGIACSIPGIRWLVLRHGRRGHFTQGSSWCGLLEFWSLFYWPGKQDHRPAQIPGAVGSRESPAGRPWPSFPPWLGEQPGLSRSPAALFPAMLSEGDRVLNSHSSLPVGQDPGAGENTLRPSQETSVLGLKGPRPQSQPQFGLLNQLQHAGAAGFHFAAWGCLWP